MRMRTKRLYLRIYLHALGVLLVVGLATTGVFSLGQRGAFLSEVTERLGRHLASDLGAHFDDINARQAALDSLHRDFELELTLRDASGRVLAAAGGVRPALSQKELSALLRHESKLQGWSGAAAPIFDPRSGALLGFLQMAPPQHYRTMGLGALSRPLIAVALVLLLVAVASLPLSRRIARPVLLLTIATKRFGSGELSYRIPVRPDCDPPRRPGRPERLERLERLERAGVPWPHGRGGPFAHASRMHWQQRRRPLDEVEELMVAWNEMADRIEKLLNGQRELLANISHELRSPLTRVRVALALLPREGESEARISEVEDDLSELERLIEDVLMASRLEATGLPAHPGPVACRPLLEQVAERGRHTPLLAGKTVEVAAGEEITLNADATLLKRALSNLVENAAKYGASPIVISAIQQEHFVEIAVTDEGEGIPQDERERVLEPFYRRDKAHTQHAPGSAAHGFGLGLTLARRVAEAHGGTISVGAARTIDAKEVGCRVTLRLPRSASE